MTDTIQDRKFRSLKEVNDYLKELTNQLRQDFEIADQSMKKLKSHNLKAIKELDISGDPGGKRKVKKTIGVDFPVVEVPNKTALQKNYNIAENLSHKYQALLHHENEINMTFRNANSPAFKQIQGGIAKLKKDMEKRLRELFTELNSIAEGHAPKEYKEFVKGLADELNENQHIECDNVRTFTYVAVDKEGELSFTGYIHMSNAVSDEGKVAPNLYLAVRWTVATDGGLVEIFVEHEFVQPTRLTGGATVSNLNEALRAITNQLSMEGFSSQIGNLPVHMQLKNVDNLTPEAFTAAEHIKKVEAGKDELVFILKEAMSGPALSKVANQLFLEVKALVKAKRSTKVRMRPESRKITFTFTGLNNSDGIHPHDLEWLGDKYKLSDSQLRKIANEINEGSTADDKRSSEVVPRTSTPFLGTPHVLKLNRP